MSTQYEPGQVCVATVRGVKGVRVFRTVSAYYPWETAVEVDVDTSHADSDVTDVRPLVVLDLDSIAPEAIVKALRDKDDGSNGTGWARVADQIEAQTKPPRIPEPGLWGVVEAWPGSRVGRPVNLMRDSMHETSAWRSLEDGSAWEWEYLVDPVLVRDGIEDGAS